MNQEFKDAKVIYKDFNDTIYEDKLLEFVKYKKPTIVVYDFKDTFRILFFNNSTQFKENYTFDEMIEIYKKATKIDYSKDIKQQDTDDDDITEVDMLKYELVTTMEMLMRRI